MIRVVSSLTKRPLNETRRKYSPSWLKAHADVSSTHLNKHSLINSLAAHIDETCPRRVGTQAVLPPKISPVLPGSQYIYNQGYLFKTGGSAWNPIPYTSTESLIANAWYPKTATATISLSLTSTELQNPSYALAYICTWMGSSSKCGCRDSACTQSYWIIQSFKR